MTKTLDTATLKQFTGTEHWYRHPLNRQVLYTDGARYVAEHGGAYWLLDAIALAQRSQPAVAAKASQVWKLAVRPDHTATLTCEDGDEQAVFSKHLTFTDFPLAEITFYFCNSVIHLPSKY